MQLVASSLSICCAILVASSVCLAQPVASQAEAEPSWSSVSWLTNLRNKMDDARTWDPNSFATFVLYPKQVGGEPIGGSRPVNLVLGSKRSNGNLDMLAGGAFGGKRANGKLDMIAGDVMGKRSGERVNYQPVYGRLLEAPVAMPRIFYDISAADNV